MSDTLISCIGMWGEHSQIFLWVIMPLTTLVFALPLFFAPLTWARWFQWRLPVFASRQWTRPCESGAMTSPS